MRLLRVAVLVVAAASQMLCAVVGEADSSDREVVSPEVGFEISSPKATYVLYEPVLVQWRLRNSSGRTIELMGDLGISSGVVGIWVEDSAGSRRRLASKVLRHSLGGGRRIGPGKEARGGTRITFDPTTSKWMLPTVGTYQIEGQVALSGGATRIPAESVRVEITAVTSSEEGFLRALGSSDRWTDSFRQIPREYCRDVETAECYLDLHRIATDYPKSAYAPYLLERIANNIATGVVDLDPSGTMALDWYKEWLQRWPEHVIKGEVYGQAINLSIERDNPSEANELLARFESEYPERRMDIEQLRRRLAGVE